MARSLQLILCFVIASGVVLYLIQYINQNKILHFQASCTKKEKVCQSQEAAISCNMLDYCAKIWSMKKNKTISASTNLTKLDVKVYYESFCPDSEGFIIKQLFPTFKKLYASGIFTLAMIPYGNAEETIEGDKWTFTCQHGAEECVGNLIETCAIHTLQNTTRWMSFIYCMEQEGSTPADAEKCTKKEGFDYKPIKQCVDGPLGNQLQHEMALKTDSLRPKHTFIPWITINGESEGIQKKALEDLFGLMCHMYKGKKPKDCLNKEGQESQGNLKRMMRKIGNIVKHNNC